MKVSILRKNGQEIADLNRRKAIRERCLNCSGWEIRGVSNCELTDCPLYSFRSGHGKQNSKERVKAIRQYCLGCVLGQRSEVSNCPCQDCSLFPYRQSVVDRSTEIKSTAKIHHIQHLSPAKNKKPYLSMDIEIQAHNKTSLTGAGIGSGEKMVLSPWQNHRSIHSRGMNGIFDKR